MSASDSDKEEFKVVDKRRYHDDGEPREDAPKEPETRVTKSENVSENIKPAQDKPKAQATDAQSAGANEQKVDFSSFIVSLATQTMIMLGEIPNPETGEQVFHAEAARQTIDIVGMIQEKTKGNLNEQEEKLLTEVLTSIRLAYVNKTK